MLDKSQVSLSEYEIMKIKKLALEKEKERLTREIEQMEWEMKGFSGDKETTLKNIKEYFKN